MRIIIKATNTKLSPNIDQYIEEKIGGLEKFLKQFNPELVEVRVEIGMVTRDQRHGKIFRAEVNLSIDGKLLRAVETGESLQAAIDLVRDELAREIRQYKDKQLTMFIRGARSWKKFWRLSPSARYRSSKSGKIIKR